MISDELREKYKKNPIFTAISTLWYNLSVNGDVVIICSEALKEFEKMIEEKEANKITNVECTCTTVNFDKWYVRLQKYYEYKNNNEVAIREKQYYANYYHDGYTIEKTYDEVVNILR